MNNLIESFNSLNIKDINKLKIIDMFNKNVKNKKINLNIYNSNHCGKEGHWLENAMGIKANSKNEPDIHDYEMKKYAKVITFIDKVPSKKIFLGNIIKPKNDTLNKLNFWKMFGSKKTTDNITLGGWHINRYDNNGQIMIIDKDNNIIIQYNYNEDKRINKLDIIDNFYKLENKIILQWDMIDIKNTIDNKYNKNGFFICKKDKKTNTYNRICFGKSFTFEEWIDDLKKGKIYFDGYSKCDGRWRGQFRAKNTYWDSLLLLNEEY